MTREKGNTRSRFETNALLLSFTMALGAAHSYARSGIARVRSMPPFCPIELILKLTA